MPGKSPHAFLREAFGVQARLLNDRRAFVAAAQQAERRAFDTGSAYASADVDAYFDALAQERVQPLPAPRPWRR